MPSRTATFHVSLFLITVLLAGCSHRMPQEHACRPFSFRTDRFAFANETVWHYVDGEVRSARHPKRTSGDRYTRRCFVLCRTALEFWKFARFEPQAKPLPKAKLAKRIRDVRGHGAWKPPLSPQKRVVFPGYRNLYQLSNEYPTLFKNNLGAGWPTYFRPGNAMIVFPPSARHQAQLNRKLRESLQSNHPMVLWLVNFPSLNINHAVLAYSFRRTENGLVYSVYDPNDSDAPKRLTFNRAKRMFSFQKTFYFKGGEVDARPVYQTPLK